MDLLSAIFKTDDTIRKAPHSVKKFVLRQIGEKYYIFAYLNGALRPAVVGRYTDKIMAQTAYENLKNIIK